MRPVLCTHQRPPWRMVLLLCIPLLLLCAHHSFAQQQPKVDTSQFINHFPLPDVAAPLRSTWGFNDDEFSIGAYTILAASPTETATEAVFTWRLLRDLGISILESRAGEGLYSAVDALIDEAHGRDSATDPWNERVIALGDTASKVGHAREVIFYAFDSAQSYYAPCFFRTIPYGLTVRNPEVTDFRDTLVQEQVYDITNTPGDTIVAERIVMGFDTTRQTQRYPPSTVDTYGTYEHSGDVFAELENNKHDFSAVVYQRPARYLFFNVKAHLFDEQHGGRDPNVGLTDTLLTIELHNERTIGQKYIRGWGDTATSNDTTAELYKRIFFTKSQLLPDTSAPALNYNIYRVAIDSIDMIQDISTGLGGPWHSFHTDPATQQRFDIKVRWTGKEKLALHSIAVRDTMAQLLFESSARSIDFKARMLQSAIRLMRGPAGLDSAVRYNKLIRMYTGDEPRQVQYAGFNWYDSTLYRYFTDSAALADPNNLSKGLRAWHGRNESENGYHAGYLSSDNEINVETYGNSRLYPYYPEAYGLPFHIYNKPAVREHNGGRFQTDTTISIPYTALPEIVIDTTSLQRTRDSVELYTGYVQWFRLGATMPGVYTDPYYRVGDKATSLWYAALASRRSGRRVIHWPAIWGAFNIGWNDHTIISGLDTLTIKTFDTAVMVVEPAELRAAVNLGLCYGSRGVQYPLLGGIQWHHGASTFTTDFAFGSEITPQGPFTNDTNNVVDSIVIHHWNHDPSKFTISIPNVYMGWKNGRNELRWMNTVWLPTISQELRKLHWRNAYSINYSVPQPFMDPALPDPKSRPLPSTEIVDSVETYTLFDGVKDAPHHTYVELGLFDTKKDASNNPLLDTNYIFVLNRRTFERTPDLRDTLPNGELTTRMKMMDSVTENRLIKLHLNLKHPDSTQYNFIRVREVAADSTPLSYGHRTYRHLLDTAVFADSAVTVLLGPGRATLLRITYMRPGDSIFNAALPRNGQRKFVYSGKRYYAVYERDSAGAGKIYYQRSVSMRGDSMGGIVWEPTEYEISDDGTPGRTDHRTPSLTMRIYPGVLGSISDTVITAVWSCHLNASQREIVLRNIKHDGGGLATLPPIESVDTVSGYNPMEWGTPVISSLAAGEAIAYSDTLLGIIAKFRYKDTSTSFWLPSGVYSAPVSVAPGVVFARLAQFPTMPTFTNIREGDSTVGIAWQEAPCPTTYNATPDIYYTRLKHDTALVPDFQVVPHPTMLVTFDLAGEHYHPSLDMHLDVWGELLEGLTWEEIDRGSGSGFKAVPDNHIINFVTLFTPFDVPGRRVTGPTQRWTLNRHFWVGSSTAGYGKPLLYPNTASLQTRYDSTTQNEPILFSLVYNNNDTSQPLMKQDMIHLATDFIWPSPKLYAWGGSYPTNSATWVRRADWQPDDTTPPGTASDTLDWAWRAEGYDRQPLRPAVMYQTVESGDSVLRTSRQFLYAKTRPSGYMATGRQVYFHINDSLRTGISVLLHDVWMATDSTGVPLSMVRRDTSQLRIDSVPQVAALLRTIGCTASDSVQIGFLAEGVFMGDSGIAGSAAVHCYVELVDSVSGSVVSVLDSFAISNTQPAHYVQAEPVVDLLSGTYYVRMRLDTASLPAIDTSWFEQYPVDETSQWIENPPLGKLRRTGATTGAQARVTAQPNPSTGATEIRFSIPYRDYVAVTVYDGTGREVARPVGREMMEAGRYAIDYDGTRLQAGTYLIEVRTSSERVVEKFVVVR